MWTACEINLRAVVADENCTYFCEKNSFLLGKVLQYALFFFKDIVIYY